MMEQNDPSLKTVTILIRHVFCGFPLPKTSHPARDSATREDNGIDTRLNILKSFSSSVDQGILFFDHRWNLLFANSRAMALLGVDTPGEAEDIIRKNCPSDYSSRVNQEGKTGTYIDVSASSRGGSGLLGVELRAERLSDGEPVIFALLHDFSSWKKLDDMRKDFISSVSHRLRTPITSIQNSLELLFRHDSSFEQVDRRKLMDIGLRNIRKFTALLDELQKIFMVESEEMNVTRNLFDPGKEISAILQGMAGENIIAGFDMESCDAPVFAGRSKLEAFVATVVGLFRNWLGEGLCIRAVTRRDTADPASKKFQSIRVTIKPEPVGQREGFADFLQYREPHRSLLLEKLASAMEAVLSVGINCEISLSIPEDPPFDREKDLVHPLHVISEKAQIEGKPFSLVHLGLRGRGGLFRDNQIVRKTLCEILGSETDCFVSKGEEPFSYLIFLVDKTRWEINSLFESIEKNYSDTLLNRYGAAASSLEWKIKLQKSFNPVHIDTCKLLKT